jgi:hypothetical protein
VSAGTPAIRVLSSSLWSAACRLGRCPMVAGRSSSTCTTASHVPPSVRVRLFPSLRLGRAARPGPGKRQGQGPNRWSRDLATQLRACEGCGRWYWFQHHEAACRPAGELQVKQAIDRDWLGASGKPAPCSRRSASVVRERTCATKSMVHRGTTSQHSQAAWDGVWRHGRASSCGLDSGGVCIPRQVRTVVRTHSPHPFAAKGTVSVAL